MGSIYRSIDLAMDLGIQNTLKHVINVLVYLKRDI